MAAAGQGTEHLRSHVRERQAHTPLSKESGLHCGQAGATEGLEQGHGVICLTSFTSSLWPLGTQSRWQAWSPEALVGPA